LAQEHTIDMAHRDHLDHRGFASRVKRGARAENVAYSYNSQAKTIAQWAASPPHAANMRLPEPAKIDNNRRRDSRPALFQERQCEDRGRWDDIVASVHEMRRLPRENAGRHQLFRFALFNAHEDVVRSLR